MNFLILTILFFLSNQVKAQDLKVLFIERPPFLMLENDQAKGLLIDKSSDIFKKLNLKVNYYSYPISRIMVQIKKNDQKFVVIGFARTEEREKYGIFSPKIYQTSPPLILIKKKNLKKFKKFG